MKKLILIIVLVLTACSLSAQKQGQELIDSLLIELPKAKQDTNKVNLLENLSFNYYAVDPNKGIEFGKEALGIAKDIGWEQGQAKAYNSLGVNYWAMSNFDKALEYYHKALKINKELGNKKGIATNLGNSGIIYDYQSNYDKALEYDYKALKIYEEMGDKDGISFILGNIGTIYTNQSNYSKALEYYHKALKINEEMGNKKGIAAKLGNIGIIYFDQSNFSQALEYYHKALKINEEMESKKGIAINLANIGDLYYKMSQDSIFKKSSEKNLEKSRNYLIKAVELFEELNATYWQQVYLSILSQTYTAQGEDKKALEAYQEHVTIKDSIFSQETQTKIANLGAVYENEKKQAKIEALESKNEYQTKLSYYLFAVFGLTFVILVVLFIFYRNKRKSNQKLEAKNIIIRDANIELETLNESLAGKNQIILQAKAELEVFNDTLQEKIAQQTKELLKANKELTKVDEAKSYFIGILAHELSTPIMGVEQSNNVIKMGMDNLIESFNGHDTDPTFRDRVLSQINDIYTFSQILIKSTKRLKHINDMSQLISKLQLDTYQIVFQEVNICESIIPTILEKSYIYRENTIITNYNCKEEEVLLKIDYYSIEQVIDMIITNAIKYSPDNSKIIIETKDDANYYYISIIDEGQGFSQIALDNLFSLFSSDDLMAHQEGIGLSLTAASIIMELNKGKITINNNEEKGATVTLQFEKYKRH